MSVVLALLTFSKIEGFCSQADGAHEICEDWIILESPYYQFLMKQRNRIKNISGKHLETHMDSKLIVAPLITTQN